MAVLTERSPTFVREQDGTSFDHLKSIFSALINAGILFTKDFSEAVVLKGFLKIIETLNLAILKSVNKRLPQDFAVLANHGDSKAQDWVAKGYAVGCYGIKMNPEELKKLAFNKGWSKAREQIVNVLVEIICRRI